MKNMPVDPTKRNNKMLKFGNPTSSKKLKDWVYL